MIFHFDVLTYQKTKILPILLYPKLFSALSEHTRLSFSPGAEGVMKQSHGQHKSDCILNHSKFLLLMEK